MTNSAPYRKNIAGMSHVSYDRKKRAASVRNDSAGAVSTISKKKFFGSKYTKYLEPFFLVLVEDGGTLRAPEVSCENVFGKFILLPIVATQLNATRTITFRAMTREAKAQKNLPASCRIDLSRKYNGPSEAPVVASQMRQRSVPPEWQQTSL